MFMKKFVSTLRLTFLNILTDISQHTAIKFQSESCESKLFVIFEQCLITKWFLGI